jgi:parallel beta-helix repeat protein
VGTLSSVSANFVSGVARATLTSTNVGTATIKVTSGSLAYVTTTVTLVGQVWVAKTGDNGNPGTQNLPVLTIDQGLSIAPVGGTVNVLPGTYEPGGTINIGKAGLTLQSTGGNAVTIIVSGGSPAIRIQADDVTVKDFTVDQDVANSDGVIVVEGTKGVTVQDNIIKDAPLTGIVLSDEVAEATISGNLIKDCGGGIILFNGAKDCVVSNNTITDCGEGGSGVGLAGGEEDYPTTGNTITGNTMSNGGWGIFVGPIGGDPKLELNENVIEGNTISGNRHDGIKIAADLTVTNLSITGNLITANEEDGIFIESWASSNAINNNNIYGNGLEGDPLVPVAWLYDIENSAFLVVDAENNWWGTAIESAIDVTDYVDYSPWLNAAYPDGEPTTVSVPAIVLESGWNLISLPLVPTATGISTVLADLIADGTADQVRTYDQGIWYNWASTPPPGTLTLMKDGPGYWIQMNAGDVLVITGRELPAPPQTPPSYRVYIGWNMIGFKSLTPKIPADYLGAVKDSEIILKTTSLTPGSGYWLAVNADGIIYP